MTRVLLCTDLDRTLIPNGEHPESPQARSHFHGLVNQPAVTLAYVTGRDPQLVKAAIAEYHLPRPDFVIGDVGSTLYVLAGETWEAHPSWQDQIAQGWGGKTAHHLEALLTGIDGITLQEQGKQSRYKLSYYFSLQDDIGRLLTAVNQCLQDHHIAANLIWSVDEVTAIGLLDILPPGADKRQAIEFLMAYYNYDHSNTLFAGDSRNDMSVLTSAIKSVLVANAHPDVKSEALAAAVQRGYADRLYIAQGNFLGMNGNYSAGILEGVYNYYPHLCA